MNHSQLCAGVCRLALRTDPDKFKMSVSIFYGSLMSQSWSSLAGVDGLGDHCSDHHLFSGMGSSSKRLREREEVRWKRRESGAGLWRTTGQADSSSLTAN